MIKHFQRHAKTNFDASFSISFSQILQKPVLKLANYCCRKCFIIQGFSAGFSRSWLKLAQKLVLATFRKCFSTQVLAEVLAEVG